MEIQILSALGRDTLDLAYDDECYMRYRKKFINLQTLLTDGNIYGCIIVNNSIVHIWVATILMILINQVNATSEIDPVSDKTVW